MTIEQIFELDFNKPIYTKMKDGIHQVKFDRAELVMHRASITDLYFIIEARLAGKDGYVSPKAHLRVTNDLEALVLCEDEYEIRNLTHSFGESIVSIYRRDVTTATYITKRFSTKLLQDYATFGYHIKNNQVCRYIWEGTKPISVLYENTNIKGISDSSYGLQFDLLSRSFIEPKGTKYVGGHWIEPKYYDTAEQCRKENGIKVFTFEN